MRTSPYHNLFLDVFGALLASHIMTVDASAGSALKSATVQNDKVVILQRVIVLKRGEKGADYKEAIIKIPNIEGISDPDVLRKIRSILDLKNVFGDSLEEIRSDFKESFWLSGITCKVNYNANFILDIRIKKYSQDEFAAERLGNELREPKFGVDNLDNFSVNNKGVTFRYDFGFPHVIKALEPSGRYFFGYERLKAHIKSDGLLGVFVR